MPTPKYQKISEKDGSTTFTVIAEDGTSETHTYICLPGETEDEMMSRVAHHFNDEIKKSKEAISPLLTEPEEVKDAIAKKDLPKVDNK